MCENTPSYSIWTTTFKTAFCRTPNLSHFHSLKGYLHYKTITSQNVPSKAQVKSFFLFHRKVMFYSKDIQFFVFLTIP